MTKEREKNLEKLRSIRINRKKKVEMKKSFRGKKTIIV